VRLQGRREGLNLLPDRTGHTSAAP
jgi:hypothetical protein